MKRAGAVIVTCNSEAEIGPCLDAALRHVPEVVVVDNDSRDGTRQEARKRPRARWIANSSNRGFAAAVNQGIRALDAPFVLLLNPDAVLLGGIEPLVEACSEPGVAAAAGKLVDEGNRTQAGFVVRRFPTALALSFEVLGINRVWPRNPVNRSYRCLDLDLDRRAEVEQPAGAFLLVRRDAWLAVGGLDEGFHPLWFEDVDLMKRLRGRGYRIVYQPAAAARHTGGHSIAKMSPEQRLIYWYASLLRYSAKHFGPLRRRVVCGALLLGSALRMALGILLERSLSPFRAYARVMRLACLGLVSSQIGGQRVANNIAPIERNIRVTGS